MGVEDRVKLVGGRETQPFNAAGGSREECWPPFDHFPFCVKSAGTFLVRMRSPDYATKNYLTDNR